MMLVGMAPFGSLLAGWAADQIGATLVVAVGGGVCVFAGMIFARHLPQRRAAARAILAAREIVRETTVKEGTAPSQP